jgi:hypothetical protein
MDDDAFPLIADVRHFPFERYEFRFI